MQALFVALDSRFSSRATCAAALGISRQALHQAHKRRRLSPRVAIRAAELLDIAPDCAALDSIAAALPEPERATLTRARKITAPVCKTAPNLPHQPPCQPDVDKGTTYPLYYVKSHKEAIAQPNNGLTRVNNCSTSTADNASRENNNKKCVIHFISSEENRNHLDLARWVLAVARIPADSPRFVFYVSRWLVPEKIAAAKLAGTFDAQVSNCPPIHPDLLRFVPAAIAEYIAFSKTQTKRAGLLTPPAIERNKKRRAGY